jgi:hypothetical protein
MVARDVNRYSDFVQQYEGGAAFTAYFAHR